MSKYIPGNQKHLTLDDRLYIERSLNMGCSFKEIVKYLCKNPTTLSKEIKTHRLSNWYHKGTFCPTCNYVWEHRARLDKIPYVYTSYPEATNHCSIAHIYHYDARFSDRKYQKCLYNSRSGISISKHEL